MTIADRRLPESTSRKALPAQDGNRDANGKSAFRMPLAVLPKGAIYSFPYVLGLDNYAYEFGQNMATRASNRFQEKVKASSDSGQGGRLKATRSAPCTCATMVQAGLQGSTTILCHHAVHSSDSGASKVRKRRQKLTDDLLHDLVVSYGDPVEVVHKWFQIFQHYSDPPTEIALPSLPERREETPTVPPLNREKTNTSQPASRISTKSTKRSCNFQRPISAPCLKRPEIVRIPRKKCNDLEDHKELHKTRSLLKEAGLAGAGAGQLDLAHRFKAQTMNGEAFEEWMESFTFLWNLQKLPVEAIQHLQASKTASAALHRRISRQLRCRRDVTSRYMSKLNEKVSGLGVSSLGTWEMGGEGPDTVFDSSAASSATIETDDEAEIPTTLNDLTLNQIMLRSSSLAMISCGIVQKKTQEKEAKGSKGRSKAAFEEIARSRIEILNSVAPAQMTLKNFSSFLAVFGVLRRETMERIAKHLFFCVPRASRSGPKLDEDDKEDKEDRDDWQDDATLPFEVFYKFVRALSTPLFEITDETSARHPFIFSELLCRILFCALTGHEGVGHSAGAAIAFKDDANVKSISLQNLSQSLKLFLSQEQEGSLRNERSEQEVQGLAEFGA